VVLVRDLRVDLLSTDAALTTVATRMAVGLFAVAGAALGALVRSQTVAIAGALVWWFVLEGLIPDLIREPGIGNYPRGRHREQADRCRHTIHTGRARVADRRAAPGRLRRRDRIRRHPHAQEA
jgi:hypothetical protein